MPEYGVTVIESATFGSTGWTYWGDCLPQEGQPISVSRSGRAPDSVERLTVRVVSVEHDASRPITAGRLT